MQPSTNGAVHPNGTTLPRDQLPPTDAPNVVEMGGRLRRLRLDFYALMRLEEATGERDLGQGGIRRYADMSVATFTSMTHFIWCLCLADDHALDTENPRDGIREVGHWFDIVDMYDTYQKALAAAASAMPAPEPAEPTDETPPLEAKPKPTRKRGSPG